MIAYDIEAAAAELMLTPLELQGVYALYFDEAAQLVKAAEAARRGPGLPCCRQSNACPERIVR